MKKLFASLAIAISTFAAGNSSAEEMFSTELFSVEVPANMIVNHQKNNTLFLAFPGDKDLKKGSLILAAEKGKPIRTDIKWREVRAHVLGRDKKILFEKEVSTPALTWKVIGTEGAKLEDHMAQEFQYYGESNDSIYFLHYYCLLGDCNDIEAAISTILSTFRPIESKKQPN